MKLRKRCPINYFEPQEPSFDDYVYCDHCADFVFEYCSIHGGLLVIPDEKVPMKLNYPSFVPRSALTIPKVFLHLAPSCIPGAGLGVFTTLTLPRGVRFGPYKGRSTTDVDSTYCWQLHEEDRRKKGVVDASDPNASNWMRYVNCARHWCEQNLVAFQYQGQIYYRTIKIVPRFTELLIFYGGEFAHLLNINLKKYDDPEFFPTVIQANTSKTAPIQRQSTETLLCEDITEIPEFEEKTETKNKVINEKSNEADTIEDYVIIDEDDLFNNDSNSNESVPTVEYDEANNNFIVNFSYSVTNNIENTNDINILDNHKNSDYGNTICNICNFKSNSQKNLKRHIRSVHKIYSEKRKFYLTNPIQESCEFCQATFSVRTLVRHLKKVHRVSLMFCDDCNYRTYSNRKLSRHMESHPAGNKDYQCEKCHYKTIFRDNYLRHKVRCHKKKL